MAAGGRAAAQTWSTAGNGQLTGTYYFRQILYQVTPGGSGGLNGGLADAWVAYGNIVFDGAGHYTISSGSELDFLSTVSGYGSAPQPISGLTGTYSIAASGLGFMSSPNTNFSGDTVYGLVSKGIFIGSSTENSNSYNDLFIAAPVSSPAPTIGTFQGSYTMAYMNFPNTGAGALDPTQAYDATFQLNPNGQGNIGTVNVTQYIGANVSTPITTSEPGITYAPNNGAEILTFPRAQGDPVNGYGGGQEYLYLSPDGNFVFGGSPEGFDMFVGVRNTSGTTAPNFSGLYYQAGLDEDESTLSKGYVTPDAYWGSFDILSSSQLLLGHQRVNYPAGGGPVDYTYDDTAKLNPDGTWDDALGDHHTFTDGGAIGIGYGVGSATGILGITVAIQGPTLTGPGVFLNPTGLQNAGSFALFTASLSPGEYIALNGTGLANSTASDPTFQDQLAGVTVMIGNWQAPLHLVSPTLILALVPYEIPTNSAVNITVSNNGVLSSPVSAFTGITSPGLFTQTENGIGYAAAQHSKDYSLITPNNPAQIGETIILYGTGLGAVSPQPPDGTITPSSPLSGATNAITVDFGGVQAATPSFVGLTPTAAGLYQINVQIPTGVSSGDNFADIGGPDSYTTEALISIGGAATAARVDSGTGGPQVRRAIRPNPHNSAKPAISTRRITPK